MSDRPPPTDRSPAPPASACELLARIEHLAASVGDLIDRAAEQRAELSEIRALIGSLASAQVAAHEAIRRLQCRADGAGCLVRRMLRGDDGS